MSFRAGLKGKWKILKNGTDSRVRSFRAQPSDDEIQGLQAHDKFLSLGTIMTSNPKCGHRRLVERDVCPDFPSSARQNAISQGMGWG